MAGLGSILADQDAASAEETFQLANQKAIVDVWGASLASQNAILVSQNALLADQEEILADWDAILADQDAMLVGQNAF